MQFRVIALDPGGTTGWATYTAERMDYYDADSQWTEWYSERWDCGQIGPQEHHELLYNWLEFQRVDSYHIVCESFEFRGGAAKHRDNLNLMSKEYIGVVKLFAQQQNSIVSAGDFSSRFQTAAMGKGFITDKKIKEASLWYPNQKHAMDAMRHLLYSLVRDHSRQDLVRRWWAPATTSSSES